ncbi:hypothetical protein KSC_090810 [Ktedonobacter sp. SOSP1-52]|nr:condensation domain-containing protein [Ktedonobacter sp. SOSP1-52]GHO70189.1 hypothetical protein KSC_090810 [Ktedonobacter sp. SOSP1-52]
MQKIDLQAANLSKQQERTWRWLQDNQLYGTQGMFLLEGKLEVDRLQQAIQQGVQRYEILHTTFSVMPGMELPMQVIGHEINVSCPLMNLQSLDASAQQNVLVQQWEDLCHHAFDLEHGPLLYAILFRLDAEHHVLLMRMSALCADTGTLKHFSQDILRLYSMLQQGTSLQDEEDDDEDMLQYIDVISWQNDLLTSEGRRNSRRSGLPLIFLIWTLCASP